MIMNDEWLLANAVKLGVEPSNVNPASVDLQLGKKVLEVNGETGVRNILDLEEMGRLHLNRSCVYLCHSIEHTFCPNGYSWMCTLRSTMGRRGIRMSHMGWGDPGFNGQVNVMLACDIMASIEYGERFVQLVYMQEWATFLLTVTE